MSETDETPETEGLAAPPRRRGRTWLIAFTVLLSPFILFAIAIAVAVGRDIPAPDWIVAEIEGRAAEGLSGGRLDVGEVSVNLGRDLHPRVRLLDTTLLDASGASIARIPVIECLFSPRGALFEREA